MNLFTFTRRSAFECILEPTAGQSPQPCRQLQRGLTDTLMKITDGNQPPDSSKNPLENTELLLRSGSGVSTVRGPRVRESGVCSESQPDY